MKKREMYNYSNPQLAFLRSPMREIMSAYGEAERHFALLKEITWAEFGMKSLTEYLHALEHIQPDKVDIFKKIMATQGLMVEYPAISELAENFPTLDRVFEVGVGLIDEIDGALRSFILTVDGKHPEYMAMARSVETLLTENSEIRTFLLEAWAMWDNEVSASSFDNWIAKNAPDLKKDDLNNE